jgi:anti-sigma factor RsiW
MSAQCTDRVVGDILSSWRYDISGLAPEMRVDYEAHLAECNRCHTRQRIHRAIDIGLILIATVSAGLFALAFGAIWKLEPRHAVILEVIALAGFAFSLFVWLVVALVTPAPVVMVGVAMQGAAMVHDRLPEGIRDRIPETISSRLPVSNTSNES